MSRINSNRKGKQGELEFANLCKEYGFDTRRSQQYSGEGHTADVVGLPTLHTEVKRVERLNIEKAMDQCLEDKHKDDLGIVAHRKNNRDWLVTMTFLDFMEMYKRYLITLD